MIIGISGLIGSGKNTCADFIKEILPEYHFEYLSFAARLKDMVAVLFNWDREMLEGKTEKSRAWRMEPDPFWSEKTNSEFTPRKVLQNFGGSMKTLVCENVWASIVEQEIINNPNKNYLITDLRYQDEIRMVEKYGGYLLEIQRGENPFWYKDALEYNQGKVKDISDALMKIHSSEWKWIGASPNYILIHNDGTLQQFKENIEHTLHLLSLGF